MPENNFAGGFKYEYLEKSGRLSCYGALAVGLIGCGGQPEGSKSTGGKEKVHLTVFAAASMTETLNQIKTEYEKQHPDVEITFNYDSSGTLKKQIQNGAECDLFISAAQKQMNQLDGSKDATANPDKLDFIDSATRINLLETRLYWLRLKEIPSKSKTLTIWRLS